MYAKMDLRTNQQSPWSILSTALSAQFHHKKNQRFVAFGCDITIFNGYHVYSKRHLSKMQERLLFFVQSQSHPICWYVWANQICVKPAKLGIYPNPMAFGSKNSAAYSAAFHGRILLPSNHGSFPSKTSGLCGGFWLGWLPVQSSLDLEWHVSGLWAM